jgi:hypothetical protein
MIVRSTWVSWSHSLSSMCSPPRSGKAAEAHHDQVRNGLPHLIIKYFRHSYISHQVAARISPVAIGETVGHSDRGALIFRVYAKGTKSEHEIRRGFEPAVRGGVTHRPKSRQALGTFAWGHCHWGGYLSVQSRHVSYLISEYQCSRCAHYLN